MRASLRLCYPALPEVLRDFQVLYKILIILESYSENSWEPRVEREFQLIRRFHLKCSVYWRNSSKTVKIWMKKYESAQSRKSECSNQEIIQKFCCLGQVANWWRTLSPLYKAPNQFWVSDTNISGFVRCWDFQPSLTFSDFLWKIPSYGPLKKTAPSQRGSFFRLTLGSQTGERTPKKAIFQLRRPVV